MSLRPKKRLVFGKVGIDMIAGTLGGCSSSPTAPANAGWIAADLLAAGPSTTVNAQSILITDDASNSPTNRQAAPRVGKRSSPHCRAQK